MNQMPGLNSFAANPSSLDWPAYAELEATAPIHTLVAPLISREFNGPSHDLTGPLTRD